MRNASILSDVAALLLVVMCAAQPVLADTILVDVNGSGDFLHIATAVASAANGDTVLILPGVYDGPLNRNILVQLEDLTIQSENGASSTTLDCERQGRAFHVLGQHATPVIEGLTIYNGKVVGCGAGILCEEGASPTVIDCVFLENRAQGEWPEGTGGGLYLGAGSDAIVRACRFIGNIADCGGGAYTIAGNAVFTGCAFTDNHAWSSGGGLMCDDFADATITDCEFSGNDGGWSGGAIFCEYANPTIENVVISSNHATYGGGMVCYTSSPQINGCVFANNWSRYGGGLDCHSASSPSLSFCVFDSNKASYSGGGMCFWVNSEAILEHVTFFGNRSPDPGGSLACMSPSAAPVISRSIISHTLEGGAMYCALGSELVIRQSAFFDNAGGNMLCGDYDDLLFSDALFCEAAGDDLTLCADSPCLPGGNPWGVQIGAFGEGCGPCNTSVSQMSWGRLKALYRTKAAP